MNEKEIKSARLGEQELKKPKGPMNDRTEKKHTIIK